MASKDENNQSESNSEQNNPAGDNIMHEQTSDSSTNLVVTADNETMPNNSSECPSCTNMTRQSYIFALGAVTHRWKNESARQEFELERRRPDYERITADEILYRVLKANRYLARESCWVFEIRGVPSYILVAKDPLDIGDQLVEAINPTLKAENRIVLSAVVGERFGISSPESCSGFSLPLVSFSRLYSFTQDDLIKSIPVPTGKKEDEFRRVASEAFERTIFIPNNTGASDEDRAKNFVMVRYPGIYTLISSAQDRNFILEGILAMPSGLSSMRKLVDVMLTFVNNETRARENWITVVDVHQLFPFIAPRGELHQGLAIGFG
jgi:hypothetical protein